MWEKPIFDRTALDVAQYKDSCYISAELLNRIEGNTQHLAEIFGVQVQTKTWTETDFVTRTDFQRILDNVAAVRDAYHALPGTAPLPAQPSTHWKDINAVEQMLWGIRELWQRNENNKTYVGEIYPGEEIGVI